MRSVVLGLGLAMTACAALAASSPIDSLAGVYKRQFPNMLVCGEKYQSEDVIEIVKVDPRSAYVRVHLDYANGHSCGIYGVAKADGAGLTYTTKSALGVCRLHIEPKGGKLALDDHNDSCRAFCGARGMLTADGPKLSSRQTIRYMPRLLKSREYAEAMAEFQGKSPPK